jgi:hypothetical protein
LNTEDPQPIGAGQVRIESDAAYLRREVYPLSGLEGNLLQLPLLRFVVGVSPIADFELSGGPYNHLEITDRRSAPLAGLVTASGDSTHAVEDVVIGTKIRLMSESADRPALGFRFTVRLPNAKHASGMGQDTTDLSASLLTAKTILSARLVGNGGVTIMSEPLDAGKQNDVVTYGASVSRALVRGTELVAEINGRWSTRHGVAPVGTESRGTVNVGIRYGAGALRVDAGLLFGVTPIDPSVGATAGFTYTFKAFSLPPSSDLMRGSKR